MTDAKLPQMMNHVVAPYFFCVAAHRNRRIQQHAQKDNGILKFCSWDILSWYWWPDFIIRAENLAKVYFFGRNRIGDLPRPTAGRGEGESVALTGESGAGKSTLLYLLGALDTPIARRRLLRTDQRHRPRRRRPGPFSESNHRLRLAKPPSAARIYRGRKRRHAASDPRRTS